jgi:hypothetical protein
MIPAMQRSLSAPVTGFERADERITQVYDLMNKKDYKKKFEKIAAHIDGNPYILGKDIPNRNIDLLEYAIQKNCSDLVRVLLPCINPGSYKAYLHNLLSSNMSKGIIVEALKYVDVNVVDSKGNPAIFYVKDVDTLKLLQTKGARIDFVNDKNENFIHFKLRGNLAEKDLLELFHNAQLVDNMFSTMNNNNEDPLRLALAKNYTDVARYIMNNIIKDPVSLDKNNWLPVLLSSNITPIEKVNMIKLRYASCTNRTFILLMIFQFYDKNKKTYANDELIAIFEKMFKVMDVADIKNLLTQTDIKKDTVIHKLASSRYKKLLLHIYENYDVKVHQNSMGEYPHDIYSKNKMVHKLEHMAAPDTLIKTAKTPKKTSQHETTSDNLSPFLDFDMMILGKNSSNPYTQTLNASNDIGYI